jgi:hypothetical protein
MAPSADFRGASASARLRKRQVISVATSVLKPAAAVAECLPFTHEGVKVVKRKIDRLQAHSTGSFALTLSPKSWYDILFHLFGSMDPTDREDCTYIDVGCGQGHGVIYAHQLCNVQSDGVDFEAVIDVAQMTWDALIRRGDVSAPERGSSNWPAAGKTPPLRFAVNDALNSRFNLLPYTHASCIIDDAGVVLHFIALAQATAKGSKRRRRSVQRIVFLVPNRGMDELDSFGFADYTQFKVTLEGGRCSRSVCAATL